MDPALDLLVWCSARGIPLYGPTGASAHLRGLARAMRARGHRVTVATPLGSDERGAHDRLPALPAVHLDDDPWPRGLRRFGARLDGYRLAWRALRTRPDLVWERHALGSRAMERAARGLGVARYVEINAPLSLERAWPAAPRKRERREEIAALQSADRVLAVSRWLARWAVEEARCEEARVTYLPNGVCSGRPGDREGMRRALSLTGPVLGFLGSMSRWQGADRIPALLDALGAEWRALVLGDGPAAPAEHPRIVRTGVVSHDVLPDLVAAFDVAVAPYTRAAPPWFCPLKLLEYRAQGVPTVASPIGDSALLLGEGGILLDSEEVGLWAEAVRAALTLPRRPHVRSWEHVVDEALAG